MRRLISPPPNLVRLISYYLSKGQLITSICQGNLLWSVATLSIDLHHLVTVLGALHQPHTANPVMSLRHILPPLTNPRTSCWMHWKPWKAIKSLPSTMPWRSQGPCNISLTPNSGKTSPARENRQPWPAGRDKPIKLINMAPPREDRGLLTERRASRGVIVHTLGSFDCEIANKDIEEGRWLQNQRILWWILPSLMLAH